MRLDKITRAAVEALEDIKARDIQVYDVKKRTAYFDRVIVATGESNRQCRALASHVQEVVKGAGGKIYGVEGEKTGEWLLVDIGDTVIHIMQPAIRAYYNLEELWAPPPKPQKIVKASKPAKPVADAPRAARKKAVKPATSRSKTKRVATTRSGD